MRPNLSSKSRMRPLSQRIQHPHDAGCPADVDLRVLPAADAIHASVAWPTPLFSRLGLLPNASSAITSGLERARLALGLTGYAAPISSSAVADAHATKATVATVVPLSPAAHGHSILPIYIDEPMCLPSIRRSQFIEFQCHASPASRSEWGSTRGDWSPRLPSDMVQREALIDQFRDRVAMVRAVSEQPHAQVGATLAAGAVAEDVRWLIDAGFDYVCLLTDALYGIKEGQSIRFSETQRVLDEAFEAVAKSGQSSFAIHLCAANCEPANALAWLQSGVRAIGIDTILQSRLPNTSERASEGFGGFLVEYTRSDGRDMDAWCEAIRQYLGELRSEIFFAGYSSLDALRKPNRTRDAD